jgi:ATP phosphoribosyltransferase
VGTITKVSELGGSRVATSYPGLVGAFLDDAGVSATLVPLDGAVESAVRLGVADAVADVVSTGATLRKAGLEIFGPVILESSGVLISGGSTDAAATTLLKRLEGVLVARAFVLMDYDCPVSLLERACALAPGIESPTVSPLRDPEWVAVRVMVPRDDQNHVMDSLYELGARAILVSAIHAARL